jgi:hypothetical protein
LPGYPGQGLDTLIAVEEPPGEESEGPAIDLIGDPEEVMEGAHGIQPLLNALFQNAIAVVGQPLEFQLMARLQISTDDPKGPSDRRSPARPTRMANPWSFRNRDMEAFQG